uniref:DNA mismatch repair protein n=2 Tax=Trichomonas tenax TaxID=43075 RepID=A0A7H4L1B1_9EUKA|nr:DNA mismatch repair protein [Trichomonas tenax]
MKTLAKHDSTLVRATETISSPAHALREMIENSIDAGCSVLTIRIGNGGLDHISVSDNGPGISEEGLSMLCDEGVTSKEFGKDVSGGRGRALEAISYLSYLTIDTCTENNNSGWRLQFGEDHKRQMQKITRPKGTTVTAQTIFYGHPVRRHYFIEHKSQQLSEIHEIAESFAIACTANFTVSIDNKPVIQVSTTKRDSRISNVFGSDILKGFDHGEISLEQWHPEATLAYFTASPTTNSNKKVIFVINNRPCVCAGLYRAIKNEFRLCAGPKLPSGVFYITAPRNTFDFIPNSPLISVSFERENMLQKAFCEILSNVWKKTSEKLTFNNVIAEEPIRSLPQLTRLKNSEPLGIEIHSKVTASDIAERFKKCQSYVPDYGQSYDAIETKAFKDMEIIGQWNQSFIITKYGCDIYAIDQHAAMEAQNFENLRKKCSIQSQKLIAPIKINLTPQETTAAEECKQRCKEFGYDYDLQDNVLLVKTIPSVTTVATGADDLLELITILYENPSAQPMTRKARIWMQYRACHSSVRVGDTMNKAQMQNLLNRMAQSDFPWNCPHGRPTWCEIWSLQDQTQQDEEMVLKEELHD